MEVNISTGSVWFVGSFAMIFIAALSAGLFFKRVETIWSEHKSQNKAGDPICSMPTILGAFLIIISLISLVVFCFFLYKNASIAYNAIG